MYYISWLFISQVNLLTITGQDANVGRSVGSFVSQAVDRIVEKKLLAKMTWQGTAEKGPFNRYESVILAIKSKARKQNRFYMFLYLPCFIVFISFQLRRRGVTHSLRRPQTQSSSLAWRRSWATTAMSRIRSRTHSPRPACRHSISDIHTEIYTSATITRTSIRFYIIMFNCFIFNSCLMNFFLLQIVFKWNLSHLNHFF